MTTPVYVLAGGEWPGVPGARKVRSKNDVLHAYADSAHALWVAPGTGGLDVLAKALRVGRPRHGLVALEKVTEGRRVLLDALFSVVVEPGHGTRILPVDQLREVLASDDRQDLFIAARAIPEDDALVLFRGDLRSLIVPLSSLARRKGGPIPDPEDVAVTDYGQTIRLGAYEVAADALLYELDPEARRRARKRAVASEESLGGSIRRLRLQRGLTLHDFPAVSAKTVGRIERGEVQPRSATLAKIARQLRVSPEELATY
jgi:DNA-binding XRE family transcriptional regulator